jgi:hypothetical protein
MGLDSFLNRLVSFNSTDSTDLLVPYSILKARTDLDGYDQSTLVVPTQPQKDIAFVLMNGLRSLLEMILDGEDLLRNIVHEIAIK